MQVGLSLAGNVVTSGDAGRLCVVATTASTLREELCDAATGASILCEGFTGVTTPFFVDPQYSMYVACDVTTKSAPIVADTPLRLRQIIA